MDLPARVTVNCPALGIANQSATLMSVSPHGYYELVMEFSGRRHSVFAPVAQSGLIFNDPLPEIAPLPEVER